jgi:hypothetical protein
MPGTDRSRPSNHHGIVTFRAVLSGAYALTANPVTVVIR